MKKKLLFLLPAVAMVLAGCGGNPDTPTTDDPTTSGDAPTSTPASTSTPAPTSSTPYTPTHAGTLEDPLDAKDAFNLASELPESGSAEKFPTEEKYYIKDVVTSVTECSTSYGNATFSFGEPGTPFTGYRLKVGESKQAITSEDQVAVGDTVTIYSDLLNFHGTMETNDGYIVSIEMPAPTAVTVTAQGDATKVVTGGTLPMGYTTTPARAGGTAVYSVECDPAGCATIDPATGLLSGVEVGTAVVTVTIGEVHGSKEIAVSLPDKQLIDTISFHAVDPVDINSGNTAQLEWDVTWKESTFEKEDLVFSIVTEAGDPLATINQSGLVTISTRHLGDVITAKVEGAVSHTNATVDIKLKDLAAPIVKAPAIGVYKFGAYHKGLGDYLFADGTVGSGNSARYANTLKAYYKGDDFTCGTGGTEGTWRISTSASKYLGMKTSGTYQNFAIDVAPNLDLGYDWSWDSEKGYFFMMQSTTKYVLGFDATHTTFSTYNNYDESTYSPATFLVPSGTPSNMKSISLIADKTVITAGGTANVKAISTDPVYVPATGVTFTSSNTGVATVDINTGAVLGVASGQTTITGTFAPSVTAELVISVGTISKVSSISIGDTIFLAAIEDSKEISSIEIPYGSNPFGVVADYTTTPAGLYALTVCAGSAENTYAFKNGDNKYVKWSSGNTLDVTETLDANSSWTVAFDEDGNATITNSADNTRVLWYNTGSPRIAAYAGKSYASGYHYVNVFKLTIA